MSFVCNLINIIIPRVQTILGFNEPNQPDQANMSPLEAAVAWLEVQDVYGDRELVSPATGHIDTEWFDQFMAECELLGCRFDYLATHWYGDAKGGYGNAEYTMTVSWAWDGAK